MCRRPPLYQICMGIQWGIPATPQHMIVMKDSLPKDGDLGGLWHLWTLLSHGSPISPIGG